MSAMATAPARRREPASSNQRVDAPRTRAGGRWLRGRAARAASAKTMRAERARGRACRRRARTPGRTGATTAARPGVPGATASRASDVGVDHRRAERCEPPQAVRLAGGDAAGEGDAQQAAGTSRRSTGRSAGRNLGLGVGGRRDALFDERVPLVAVRALPDAARCCGSGTGRRRADRGRRPTAA